MMAELPWTLPHVVAGTMVLALNAYVLLGGADFGGGVWDLLARGPDRDAQRALIATAIGPIWEANHVWLILVVVLLFTGFPTAFAHLATALHLPITLMLVGVVLRGSAFTFRSYDSSRDEVQRRWGRIFSVASLLTPVVLGVCLGTVAAGRVPMRVPMPGTPGGAPSGATFAQAYLAPWAASPFAWAVGALTLVLFAHLAATYLTLETDDPALREAFRRRALRSQGVLLALSLATLAVARAEHPTLLAGLVRGRAALAMHAVTSVATVTVVWALVRRHYRLARLAAAAQASFLLWGWAWSQFPLLIPPDRTITALAAPRITLQLALWALGIGTLILLPSFVYLFRVFKRTGTPFDAAR